MASNRFDFLEFAGEPEDDEPITRPFGPAHLKEEPPSAQAAPVDEQRPAERAQPRIIEDLGQKFIPEEQYGDSGLVSISEHNVTPQLPGTADLRAVEVFGSHGTGAGQFNFPSGLAVDRTGILFVADVYNHRLQRITPDGAVAIVGARGSGRMQFLAPMAVAVDTERSFYVVEQGNHRVQKFSAEGILQMVFGRPGSKAGEFRSPMGICISSATGEILVADTGNARVQRFTMRGEYLGSLGAAGSVQPPLSNPQSVACDYIGNIYVADTLANRIARYDPLGRFTGHFGGVVIREAVSLAPNVRFTEPHALACSTQGDLFIADGNGTPGRLVVMNANTGVVKASLEDPGKRLGSLKRPGGIAISPLPRSGYSDGLPRSDIYVSDTMNHRIIRFTCC